MNNKSILCVIDDLCSGGAQRQLVTLAIEFKKRGNDVKFLIYNNKLFYKEVLYSFEIEVELLNNKGFISRILNFRNYIRNSKFDVIISFLAVPSFLITFASFPTKKWKVIVGERSSNPEIVKSLKSKLLRRFYFKADYIVANSHSNLNLIRQILPNISESKFKVIYNIIDTNKFKENKNYEYRSNGKLNIVIPASYRKLKNLIGLITAVNHLELNYKEKLIINWYGDKSTDSHLDNVILEAEKLITEFNLQNVIILHDVESEIQSKVESADVIGLFSFFEGLPNIICEGMACGKPIIASDISDISLILTDNKGGKLCDANDLNSIINAIKYMMDLEISDLKKMGEFNRIVSLNLFDKNLNIEKYISLFQ